MFRSTQHTLTHYVSPSPSPPSSRYVKEMAIFGNNLVELSHTFYSTDEVKDLAGCVALRACGPGC
jgi:hypothetical protein